MLMLLFFIHSLRLIAPVIREHGVEYERGKLKDRLASGAITLERTTVGDCVVVVLPSPFL